MNTAANTAQVQHAQAGLNDQVKGTVQLDTYAGSENFNLPLEVGIKTSPS